MREVGAGAGTIFEQTCFTNPEIHDAAFIDEIITNRLNEAGMWLWMFVSGLGFRQLAGLPVNIEVPLTRAINTIGPMQASVEPLWAVWCDTLRCKHISEFIAESARIFF
ncbi:hypothetical protein D3C81_1925220 [compost metagenome]